MTPRDRLERPLADLRLSVIDRCNFRCSYCMPESSICSTDPFLSKDNLLKDEEIVLLVSAFAGIGVKKLRLTGGEPLLRPGFAALVNHLSRIPGIEDLSMTTNGVLLTRMAVLLKEAGLNRVTISLDSLDEDVFGRMSGGRGSAEATLMGIAAAEAAGFGPLKINCVVQRGVNDHTVMDLLEHFRGSGHIVRLIEFLDVGSSNDWHTERVVPGWEWRQHIHRRWPLQPLDKHQPGETAQRYNYLDGKGEIGLINSITEPFCANCSRLRVTADGVLYNCLFASEGKPLRPLLETAVSTQQMEQFLLNTWSSRTDRYSQQRFQQPHRQLGQEMYRMGG